MKSKYVTAGAVALFALASCSNDDIIDSSQSDPNQITYSVTTNNITRAVNIYNSNHYSHFFVSAAYKNADNAYVPYFKNNYIEVSFTNGKKELTYFDPKHYWPNVALDFYALAYDHAFQYIDKKVEDGFYNDTYIDNLTTSFGTNKFSGQPCYKVAGFISPADDEASHQSDLMYAVTKGRTRDDGDVPLNFRHALAQLRFEVTNTVSTILVVVKSVKLSNIYCQGDLYLGKAITNDQYTTDDGDEYKYSGDCEWDIAKSKGKSYNIANAMYQLTASETPIAYRVVMPSSSTSPTPVRLSYYVPGKTDDDKYRHAAIMAIPQPFDVYSGTGDITATNAAYFTLNCTVYNINNAEAFKNYINTKCNTSLPLEDLGQVIEKNKLDLSALTSGIAGYNSGNAMLEARYTGDLYAKVPKIGTGNTNTGWEAGKRYTYNFMFNEEDWAQKKIGVTMTIDDWSTYDQVTTTNTGATASDGTQQIIE